MDKDEVTLEGLREAQELLKDISPVTTCERCNKVFEGVTAYSCMDPACPVFTVVML